MNVYLLMEEREQPEFVDSYGEEAVPTSIVLGVYETRERAENEKNRLDEEESEKCPELEDLGCDPVSYYIEERPLLQ